MLGYCTDGVDSMGCYQLLSYLISQNETQAKFITSTLGI